MHPIGNKNIYKSTYKSTHNFLLAHKSIDNYSLEHKSEHNFCLEYKRTNKQADILVKTVTKNFPKILKQISGKLY
jgi:hypothetical protein